MTRAAAHTPSTRGRLTWGRIVALILVLFALLWLVLTDPSAAVDNPPPPTAEQAALAKGIAQQLRWGMAAPARPAPVRMSAAQLAAFGVLASDAVKPARVAIIAEGDQAALTVSRETWFGRWLNLRAASRGQSSGFPPVRLSVGAVELPPTISRAVIELARFVLNRRGAELEPLDRLVDATEISGGHVRTFIRVPPKLAELFPRTQGGSVLDRAHVMAIVCRLQQWGRDRPQSELAKVLQVAFSADPQGASVVDHNRSALVAVAMVAVSPMAGELAGLQAEETRSCGTRVLPLTLHGRADLAMHWSLSGAIAAAAGTDLAEAAGEWKELADSAIEQSLLAKADPSGFSFVDLAADRSGLMAAAAAMDPATAARLRQGMLTVADEQLLPPRLAKLEDGLRETDFVQRYGTIRDPRFIERVKMIDAELGRQALFAGSSRPLGLPGR